MFPFLLIPAHSFRGQIIALKIIVVIFNAVYQA